MFAFDSVHFSCSVTKLKVRKNVCFGVGAIKSIILNIFANNNDLNIPLNVLHCSNLEILF